MKDPRSASRSLREPDSDRLPNPEDLPESRALTVLLVEDNPTDVFVIQEVIESSELNLDLRIAGNGQEALTYLQGLAETHSARPALILLDLNLPRVSGLDVLRQLRGEASPWRSTLVIVVTSSDAETDRAAAQHLGAEAYFHKPQSLAAFMQLTPLIRRVLARHSET